MAVFANVTALRDHLASLLSSELGQFDDGQPRIWIAPPKPPASNEASLECIVQRISLGDNSPRAEGQRFNPRTWSVKLVNFADDTSLNAAKEKIEADSEILLAPSRNTRYLPATSQTYEQIEFFVYDPIALNPVTL